MNQDPILILTTAPDLPSAERIASVLVEARLAACVNILPAMQSLYRWQGKLERAEEHQLLIKTGAERYREVAEAIRLHHPYEVPEIIALPIAAGLPAYLQWISEQTAASPSFYV